MLTAGLAIVENQGCLEVRILTSLTALNAATVRTAVLSAWEDRGRPQRLVVDLAGARHIDSSGVGALLEISHRIEDAGVRLVLSGLNRPVRRMLDRTGLGIVFQITEAGAPAVRSSFHG
jgi:sulfate permease, SulP family